MAGNSLAVANAPRSLVALELSGESPARVGLCRLELLRADALFFTRDAAFVLGHFCWRSNRRPRPGVPRRVKPIARSGRRNHVRLE